MTTWAFANVDALRVFLMGTGVFVAGAAFVLLIGSWVGYRVPKGTKPILSGILLLAVGALAEAGAKFRQPHNWRTWCFALAFLTIAYGLARMFIHFGRVNREQAGVAPASRDYVAAKPVRNGPGRRQPAHA